MNKKTFQIRKTPPIRPMDLISQPKPQSRKMQPAQSPDNSLLHESISHNHRSKAELENENETQKGPNQEKLPRSAPLNQNKRLFRPKVDLKVGSEVPKPNIQMKTPPNHPENRDIASSISRHARVATKASFEEKRSLESSKSNKDLSLKRPTASKKSSLNEPSNQEVPNKNADLQSRRDRTNQDLVNSEKAAEESSILSQKQLEFTLAGFGNHEAPQQQRERDSSLKNDSPLKKSITVKRNVTPAATGMFISHRETGLKTSNASRNQLLNNSRDLLEKRQSSPSSENPEDVEKLVEENKQLRNENSKKMEIIDILLHALKQQKDVLPNQNPTTQQVHSDLSAAMNPFVDLNKITTNPRESFKKTPERDSFENLKPKVPVPAGEFLSRENLPPYLPPTQDSIAPFENMKSHNQFTNKFAKADTLKRNSSHKFQTPPTKDYYKSESSPKLNYMKTRLQGIPPESTTPSSASEVSRINARSRLNLYPNSNTPSSSQAPYRSNLVSTGEQIMNNNNIGNFDNLGFRDAGWLPREKPQNLPITSVYLRNNDSRVLNENKNNQPNFIETFYPSSNAISDPYFGGSSNTLKNLRFLGAQSVKGEVEIMPFKDSPNKFSSNANPREIESLKGIKSQGALIGMSTISIIDMGQNPRREDAVIDEKPKLYIRDSGALVSDRKIGVQSTDSKTKFPKDIFSVNVKKRFFG